MRNKHLISAAIIIAMGLAAGCGGGGGGGVALPNYPTDTRTNTTSTAQYSVPAVASVISPVAATVPNSLGRAAGKVSGRVLHSVTSTIDTIEGNVGDQFTITYTNEPSDPCVLNGTLTGTVTARSATVVTIGLAGTLYYTQCAGTPNLTATISGGSMTVTSTSMDASMPTHFAFTGKSYTADITYSAGADDYNGTFYLNSETYKGSDSLGNGFDYGYTYYNTGQLYSGYNKNYINGVSNNLTSLITLDHQLRYSGNSVLPNNLVLDYRVNYIGAYWINYTEAADTSGDIVNYDVTFGSGHVGFTTTTGFVGSFDLNEDGTGGGTIKDSGGNTVATLSWTATGICSVDYTDGTITDEQFYMTNIQQALAN